MTIFINEIYYKYYGDNVPTKEYMRKYMRKWYQKNKLRWIDYLFFRKKCTSMGICLICGELNFIMLEEHHIFGKRRGFKITLCANHHRLIQMFPHLIEKLI